MIDARFLGLTANQLGKVATDLKAENDRLKAENAKLRELVCMMDRRDVLLPCMFGCNADCRFYGGDTCERIASLMCETEIEVE